VLGQTKRGISDVDQETVWSRRRVGERGHRDGMQFWVSIRAGSAIRINRHEWAEDVDRSILVGEPG
jgi:hypothetical protein